MRTKILFVATFIAGTFAAGCAPRKFNEGEVLSEQAGKKLEVPYFCQYENNYDPGATCNNTSLAMILKFHGKSITPDAIYQAVGKSNSLEALRAAGKHYGFDTSITREASVSDMKKEIDAGRPLILGADFTGSVGHFVVITGYDSTGFLVNDPAGYWDEATFSPNNGYATRGKCGGGVTGRNRHYSYKAIVRSFDRGSGRDGTAWVVYVRSPK